MKQDGCRFESYDGLEWNGNEMDHISMVIKRWSNKSNKLIFIWYKCLCNRPVASEAGPINPASNLFNLIASATGMLHAKKHHIMGTTQGTLWLWCFNLNNDNENEWNEIKKWMDWNKKNGDGGIMVGIMVELWWNYDGIMVVDWFWFNGHANILNLNEKYIDKNLFWTIIVIHLSMCFSFSLNIFAGP